MILRTHSIEIETITRVRAPQLARVVDALWALAENPADRSAKIKVALLEKQGALACPACAAPFSVAGYRGTRTAYSHRRAIACSGCRTEFIVDDEHIS